MTSFYFLKTLLVLFLMAVSLKGQYIQNNQSPCYEEDPAVFKIELEETQKEKQRIKNSEIFGALYDSELLFRDPGNNLASPSKRGNTMSLIDVLDFVTKSKSKAKTQAKTQNIFVQKPAKKRNWKTPIVVVYE